MSVRELCHCGNDKLSHYYDTNTHKYGACLCTGCKCKEYRNEFGPPPPPETLKPPPYQRSPNRPHISCDCPACRAWDNRYRGWSP